MVSMRSHEIALAAYVDDAMNDLNYRSMSADKNLLCSRFTEVGGRSERANELPTRSP
jgi:hypothetical protein